MARILLTGGSGRLGQELQALLPKIIAPSSNELDVTNPQQVLQVVEAFHPDVIVHAAAYTNVSEAERERERCWQINVQGTRNVTVAANAVQAKLIYISTDYVFSGESGYYSEDDIPGPVTNFYSLTKLIGEEAARAAINYLIIRTSFRPRLFQYPKAFSDVYTSQDYVDIIAPLIAVAIENYNKIEYSILHIATERKSVYELALRRKPDVVEGRRTEANVVLPGDVSLNIERWSELYSTLKLHQNS